MIISRTPLRVSFVGGGSDLPAFYRRHGGAVLSTAIDKYVYVTVSKKFDEAIRVAYSKTEEAQSVDEIRHPIFRAALKLFSCSGGIEITTVADVPSHGTGMGTSSSFCVGLLSALAAFQNRLMSRDELSELSCRVEIEMCGEPIGKQDQYSAAFGGFNLIEFRPDESVTVSPIAMSRSTRERLERRLLLFYTGLGRRASSILAEQATAVASDEDIQGLLVRMVKLAYSLRDELTKGNLHSFGEILHENWMLKRALSDKISSASIDAWYETARKNGAVGGKLLGAGGGGFLMFYAEESRHQDIVCSLAPLRQLAFKFESLGSMIIFYNPSKTW
jgi:D-glycero-alpha-D-manno-heptose-7-phosphate kinase